MSDTPSTTLIVDSVGNKIKNNDIISVKKINNGTIQLKAIFHTESKEWRFYNCEAGTGKITSVYFTLDCLKLPHIESYLVTEKKK